MSNTVTTRGDVKFADSVDVKLETGDIGGSPVVTGQVPEAGAIFNPGSIALEVVGRPVIVLPGDLPVYRTLRAGLSGPDVLQLKQALASMGFESGSLDSNMYDSSTAAGVKALYESVGYTPPTSTGSGAGAAAGASSADPVTQAQNDVQSAQQNLAQAQSGLAQAQAPNLVEQAQADNTVREAQRALNTATAAGDPNAIAAANDALALAALQQSIAYAPKDTSAEIAQVTAAQSALNMAQEALANAQESALTSLPASEVLYLNSLPRRVDEVSVKRGGVLNGVAMTVSGATLQIVSTVSKADAELLKPGTKAEFPAPDDSTVSAEVVSVEPQKSTGDKKGTTSYDVVLAPKDLTESQLTALKGTNVKVTIPVSATDGKVLAVPLAAVQAGPGGESRIEVLLDAEKQETKLITVETGLAADGYVEVKAVKDGAFGSGDPVVVGR
ncbi:hypothetical protein [Lysinibacter cavernae]|uniref:Multidrug efflux pump subunit AcrA (Membrane-fusion protein) n=1 Tax=Lysinibacter cavernae TaxID=1640652 RepID=A0A7X5R230_9MICO|nr:hypothetical protein [Lysinibacter cavernae]NIH54057.1 multidrug efflux pump subunit AcrA (membrane-fusion protein) [Lysinibacter cavernae]